MSTTPTHDGDELPAAAIDVAARHLGDVLSLAIEHSSEHTALVIWDSRCSLARTLTEAYRRCLPNATFIDFDGVKPQSVLAAFERLSAEDLVVLVQSTSFRLDTFRIRLELFRRSLKVIEHPHLSRMPGAEALTYIDALAYDRDYYRGVGGALKVIIDQAQEAVIESGGERLVFGAAFEPAKLNVGDYSNMRNCGGQYPIGEVFTESRDLEAVNGRVRIAFFGDTEYRVNRPSQPITLVIERGLVTDALHSTPELDRVLANIRSDDGVVWLRELGFGLNRALTPERTVSDIGTFERMCGVHLSLGSKHASYRKPNIRKKTATHHVDVFPIAESVSVDDQVIYRDGAWLVGGPLPPRA